MKRSNSVAEPTEKVLKPIKQLRASMGPKAAAKRTLAEIGISGVSKEVESMDTDQVTAEIEAVCMGAIASVLRGEGFRYIMPARTASNQLCALAPKPRSRATPAGCRGAGTFLSSTALCCETK